MRYRIGAILVALMALIGLAAPAASASPLPAASCTVGTNYGPYHVVTNDDVFVGITYPGTGKQATVTVNPGTSYLKCVDSGNIYVIHNSNGNCLRMRDKNNGFAVMEESGCNTSDGGELFHAYQGSSSNLVVFQDLATLRWLGVACGVEDGWKVWGVSNAPGNCLNWILG